MRNYIIGFISVIVLFSSCEKDNEDKVEIKISEIISPIEVPDVYKSSSFKPKVKVVNTGDLEINSFLLNYEVDITNTGYSRKPGGHYTWTGYLQPGEEVIVELPNFDDYLEDRELADGTHMLFLQLRQVNAKAIEYSSELIVKRLFTFERQ